MAFDFPSSPSEGQTYNPPGGPSYVFKSGVWLQVSTPLVTTSSGAGPRNILGNPAMQISQENGDTAGGATNGYYMADQWGLARNTEGVVTAQRVSSSDTAGSYTRVIRIAVTTVDTSIAAANLLGFFHFIEGIRMADLNWGSAAAVPCTMRFKWKSPAGTYYVGMRNAPTFDRAIAIPFVVTPAQANTTIDVTLVVPAPTVGTFNKGDSIGLDIFWVCMGGTGYLLASSNTWLNASGLLAAGQTNGMATVGNTFELSNVGLYPDFDNTGVAPRFEMPDEAAELLACQRYWQQIITGNTQTVGSGYNINATQAPVVVPYAVPMRVNPPTLVLSSASHFSVSDGGSTVPSAITITGSDNGPRNALILPTCVGLTTGRGNRLVSTSALARMAFSARM